MSLYLGRNKITPTIRYGGGGSTSATLVSKTINSNGTYNATDDNADGYSSVTVDIQFTKQNKIVDPSITSQTITADTGYDALNAVTINPVTSNIDANIVSSNIRNGVTILGVTGTLSVGASGDGTSDTTPFSVSEAWNYIQSLGGTGSNVVRGNTVYVKGIVKTIEELSMTYGNATFTITDGSRDIYVYRAKSLNGATFTTMADLLPGDEVIIYGRAEDYRGLFQLGNSPYLSARNSYIAYSDKTITENGTYYPIPAAFGSVIVDVPTTVVNNQWKTVSPQTTTVNVYPDADYTGLSRVTISAVDATIDSNIIPSNIKKDVTILGVTGTMTQEMSGTDVLISVMDKSFAGELDLSGANISTINQYFFANCTQLTSVTLPSSISDIQYQAFYNTGLTSISTSSYAIGDEAFSSCSSLTSVELKPGVAQIYSNAFANCPNLSSVSLPEGLYMIGDYCFNGSSLSSITIPSSVQIIGSYSFYNNNLSSITLPSNLSSLGDYAFANNNISGTINIPDQLGYFNSSVFANNPIDEVGFGDNPSIGGISAHAFSNTNITKFKVPESVHTMHGWALAGCSKLENVYLPSNLTTMHEETISGSKVVEVFVPNTVTETLRNVFDGVPGLTIYCEAESKPDSWSDDWNECGVPVVWGAERPYSLSYGTGTNGFSNSAYAFINGKNVDGTITNGVVYDGEKVYFPTTIVRDGVEYPMTSINNYGFCGSNIKEITIPSHVTNLGAWAFARCNDLETVTIEASHLKPTTSTFDVILEHTFYNCPKLKEIILPEPGGTLAYYYYSTFAECTSLTKANIPSRTQTISGMFYGCTSLTDITFNGTVQDLATLVDEALIDPFYDVPATVVKCTNGNYTIQ